MLRAWHAYHKQLCADAINGRSGALVEQLLDILGSLTLQDGKTLIEFVRSQNWHDVDANVRDVCLFAIDGAIMKLRQKAGLPDFDDPIPGSGKPENVFQIIKCFFPPQWGRHPGRSPVQT